MWKIVRYGNMAWGTLKGKNFSKAEKYILVRSATFILNICAVNI
jgi:hypothetical protein